MNLSEHYKKWYGTCPNNTYRLHGWHVGEARLDEKLNTTVPILGISWIYWNCYLSRWCRKHYRRNSPHLKPVTTEPAIVADIGIAANEHAG